MAKRVLYEGYWDIPLAWMTDIRCSEVSWQCINDMNAAGAKECSMTNNLNGTASLRVVGPKKAIEEAKSWFDEPYELDKLI